MNYMERFNHFITVRSSMKRLLMAALLLFGVMPMAFSQSANAVFLKDGTKVVGYVQDMDPAGSVSIRTTDGQTLSFPMSDVGNINWSYRLVEPGPGPLYRYGDVFRWKYNNMELTDKNYDRYFDDDLYHTYIGGRNQLNLGGASCVIGLGCIIVSAFQFDPESSRQSGAFWAYSAAADAFICLGCVLTGIGISRMNWVERTFNARQAAADNSLTSRIMDSMRLNPSVMLTAHNDLVIGASVSFSF